MLNRRQFLCGVLGAACAPLTAGCSAGTMHPRVPDIDPGFEKTLAQGGIPESRCSIPIGSFFLGGFECSTHRRSDGRRLDMTAATGHDRFAELDYARLRSIGIDTCRDGVSWVTTEQAPGRYDFSRVRSMIRAARRQGVFVIWDLLHFGWPDDVDVFSGSFRRRFVDYATAFAELLGEESDLSRPPIISPVNEISFLSWAGGGQGIREPVHQ